LTNVSVNIHDTENFHCYPQVQLDVVSDVVSDVVPYRPTALLLPYHTLTTLLPYHAPTTLRPLTCLTCLTCFTLSFLRSSCT
jgi:hypothetical protein